MYQTGKDQSLIKARVNEGIIYLKDVSYMCTKMYEQEYSLQITQH